MSALWRARSGQIESLQDLIDIAFADEEDGGPETLNVGSVYLNKIRRKIEPLGYTVTMNFGSPRQGYRLVKLSPHQDRQIT